MKLLNNHLIPAATLALCGACILTPSSASAQEEAHLDFSPNLQNGQIISNGWNDDADVSMGDQAFFPGVRVFGYEFGEVPGVPYFANDPGINVRDGSGFTPGSQVGFRLLNTLGYWDGSGSVAFTAPTSSESIAFTFGPTSLATLDGSGFDSADAFFGPVVDSEGGAHFHINTELLGSDGDDDPAPAAGIYLIEMALLNSALPDAASDPVFVLFNNGLDEELHEASIEYAETTLVPEPTSAVLLAGLGGLALIRRRRTA